MDKVLITVDMNSGAIHIDGVPNFLCHGHRGTALGNQAQRSTAAPLASTKETVDQFIHFFGSPLMNL